ncbi:hypothetical protein M9435_006185 [Picochlorum sp. BPE23]|nr:hypothetical protein M9435_006185 [Picochlorum sp. BPE23]
MGREDMRISGKKGRAPLVPSLKLGPTPSEGGLGTDGANEQFRNSHTARNMNKDGSFHRKREQKPGNSGVMESSTARVVSSSQASEAQSTRIEYGRITGGSYKDVLLTPRYNPGHARGMMTSRVSRFSNSSGVKSPMTARGSAHTRQTPEPSRHKQMDLKRQVAPSARGRVHDTTTPGSIVAELADQIKRLEGSMDSEEPQKLEAMLRISKAIQIAAEYIGIPAGILEMLRLHENQRIRPKLGNQAQVVSRKTNMPSTPEQKGITEEMVTRIKSIRLKISSIEKTLFPDE